MATTKKQKRVVSGKKVEQRKVARRKSVKSARPAQKGGLSEKSLKLIAEGTDNWYCPKYGGRLLYGVRKEEDVDIEVHRHREREKRADQQELRILISGR